MAALDEIFGAPPGSYPFHDNAEPRRIKTVRELRHSHEWFELAGSPPSPQQHQEVPDLMH